MASNESHPESKATLITLDTACPTLIPGKYIIDVYERENAGQGVSDETMNRVLPEGGWVIRNTLTHLCKAQGVFDFRVGFFQKEEHPIIE